MAIVVQSITQDPSLNGGSGGTLTMNVASCVVDEYVVFFRSYSVAFGPTVNGPTIGGVPMIAIGAAITNSSTRIDAWYLKVTSGGTNTVSFTQSGNNARAAFILAALRISGVDTSSPLGATPISNTGTSNTAQGSAALVSATGRLVLAMATCPNRVASATSITNGTFDVDLDDTNVTASFIQEWLGVGEAAGAAAVDIQFNIGTVRNWGFKAFDLVPAPAGGSITFDEEPWLPPAPPSWEDNVSVWS